MLGVRKTSVSDMGLEINYDFIMSGTSLCRRNISSVQFFDPYNQSERSSTHPCLTSRLQVVGVTYLEGMSSLVLRELIGQASLWISPHSIVAFLLPIPTGSLASYRRTDAATIKKLPYYRQSLSVLVAQRCWSVDS